MAPPRCACALQRFTYAPREIFASIRVPLLKDRLKEKLTEKVLKPRSIVSLYYPSFRPVTTHPIYIYRFYRMEIKSSETVKHHRRGIFQIPRY